MAVKKKKKDARIINNLLKILLVVMVLIVAAFAWNIYRVTRSGSTAETVTDTSKKSTGDTYTIGNNPTEVNKKYFKELDSAVKAKNNEDIASALVKCFVSEYYTWTNKDGNYDIGGIQYIFTDRQSDFASYTRNDYYADMDLYISQLGRDKLMQVKEVNVTAVTDSGSMTVLNSGGEEVTYPGITVTADWTFNDCSMDLSETQTSGTFVVINHDGRMEIASIQ